MTEKTSVNFAGPVRPSRRDLLIYSLAYASATLLYRWLGVRFDSSTFPSFMQFIDRDLLLDRFLESIWNFHAFPPALNVGVGIGLKLFGAHADLFFSVVYHVLGFLLGLSVLTLTARLTRSRGVANLTSTVLVLSPAFVLYQNWLMYELPSAALLTLSAVALLHFMDTRRIRWGVVFFALLAVLALTRSVFHLAWLVLVMLVLTGLISGLRRQVLLAAILPLLVVTTWYAKNDVLFGAFSSTTVAGLGMSNITTLTVPAEELMPLVKNGTLSPFALVSRYRDLEVIFSSQKLVPTGIAALDRKYKTSPSNSPLRSVPSRYNFNNLQIVAVNQYYLQDSLKSIRLFPYFYVAGLRISNLLFFSPSEMNMYFLPSNRNAVWPMQRVFNPLLYGVTSRAGVIKQPHWGYEDTYELEVNPSKLLMALWILVLMNGYMKARRCIIAGGQEDRSIGIVIAFMVGSALYVYVLGTMVELGENYRYKFLVEPLVLVLTATALTDLVRRISAMRRTALLGGRGKFAEASRDNKRVLSE